MSIAAFLAFGLSACSGSMVADNMCAGLTHDAPIEVASQGAVPSEPDMGAALGNMMLRVIEGEQAPEPATAPTRRAAPPRRTVQLNLLALSTGGQYGAFASGFLAGWTKAGTRPDFNVVTGASAGGIIAPVVFAGAAFDDRLRLNTGVGDRDLVRARGLFELLGANALYDVKPLEARVRAAIDAELIEAIAARWKAENELVIGATNIDTGRFSLLDVGLFAAKEDVPLAVKRDCLTEAVLATSAIPGFFPPRRINGQLYTDAGVREHIFLDGIERGLREGANLLNVDLRVNAYLIINDDLRVREVETGTKLSDLAERNIDLIIDEGLRSSLLRTVEVAERAGWRLRAVKAPDFEELGCDETDEIFSACVTRALYARGEALAMSGNITWKGPREVRAAALEF
ncbi:patatin-like phospholipase [Litoreibacter ponti]|uniref:Patatin-like phospholipase n=1 Tax=Litoreibacter ponti TaxID=1510457 RepID=A0A2T6BNH1_9RHOB|nr:patatin-like phospholipase family protein [Litoreibacter ponti]PTX57630.1 patatin-like phospholipase [Litoreibacter ponti]